MTESINEMLIATTQEALDQALEEFQELKGRYHELDTQIQFYRAQLDGLKKLQKGDYNQLAINAAGAPPKVRKKSGSLKTDIYQYFSSNPDLIASPKDVTHWLQTQRGWDTKGLRPRVSNLLRKIVSDDKEDWLDKPKHGKYSFKSNA